MRLLIHNSNAPRSATTYHWTHLSAEYRAANTVAIARGDIEAAAVRHQLIQLMAFLRWTLSLTMEASVVPTISNTLVTPAIICLPFNLLPSNILKLMRLMLLRLLQTSS